MPRRSTLFVLALFTLVFACSSGEPTTPDDSNNPPVSTPDAEKINALVQSLPDWPAVVPTARPPVPEPAIFLEQPYPGGDVIDYRCSASGKNLVRSFPQLLAAGNDFDNLYPGALVEGASVRSGRPVLLPLARAPITIRINLPIPEQSRRIDNVNSVTMAQAIANLQLAAANQQGTQDPVRADMVFELSEANSFDQSMTSVGVSLGYSAPFSGVGANANIDGSLTRSVRTHSVVVKFVQQMFTVRVADELQPKAADFLGASVRLADLEALQASGKIASGNLPLYVESVTYGRVLLFTLKSTDVASAEDLKVAMQASGNAYRGSGSLTQQQRQTLGSATYRFVVFGGPQDAATAAIANLDWSRFFVPASATTAVPIAFTVRTLKGRETATIFNDVVYDERGGCDEPTSYSVNVRFTRVERTSGTCLACAFAAEIRQPGALPSIMQAGVIGPTTGPLTFNVSRNMTLAPGQKFDVCSEFDTSAACGPFGYPGAVTASLNNMRLLNNGVDRTTTQDISALGAAARFTYVVRKTANFP